MKKNATILLMLSICFILTSCNCHHDDVTIHPTNLRTDAFCIIGSSSSKITQSPTITSDYGNPGDVYICIVDDNFIAIGSVVTISPGQSIVLDASSVNGSYSIQGKASDMGGMYTFEIYQP